MDLSLTEPQEMLKKMARDFLTEKCPKTLVREMEEDDKGYKPELWKDMADLGWLGLVLPEEYGGTGGNFLDLAVLLEEMGRALLPSPFMDTMISSLIILEAANKDQKHKLLPQIADGKFIFTTAWIQPGTDYDVVSQLKGTPQGDNYILNGSKLFVNFANVADYIIAQVNTGDETFTLFLVDAKSTGLKLNPLSSIAKDKQFEVKFDNVSIPQENILGEINKGQTYLDKILPEVLLAKSMEMIGGAQQTVEMSTDYAKQRVQFNQPIGAFQAIQHHIANMAVDLDSSRFMTYKAIWMLDAGLPCTKQAFMTKSWVSDAYRRIVVLGKQIHGGYGVINEYDMQLYFRRQKRDELFLGDSDFYREKIAQMIL